MRSWGALLCQEGRVFGYGLLGQYGRVTRFVNQLESNGHLNSVDSSKTEPDPFF